MPGPSADPASWLIVVGRTPRASASPEGSRANRSCHWCARSCGEPRGNSGTDHERDQGSDVDSLQVSRAAADRRPKLTASTCARAHPAIRNGAFPVGGSRATVPRAPHTSCRDRRGKQCGEVWCADQDRRAMSAEGGDRHFPVSSPSGTVVCVRCGAAQREGGQGEEAQDPQEALAPADIQN